MKLFERSEQGKIAFESESAIAATLPVHAALPRFFGKGKLKDNYYIAWELFVNPTLANFIKKEGPIKEDDAIRILQQIIEAVTILAMFGIVHRDIKPANILINPKTLEIKIIDFGLSSFIAAEETTDDYFVGTPIYMAPQVLAKRPYKVLAADIWSSGVVFLEMVLGKNPFDGAKTLAELHVMTLAGPDLNPHPPRVQMLLESMLQPDEDSRSRIVELQELLRSTAPRSRRPSQDVNLAALHSQAEKLTVPKKIIQRKSRSFGDDRQWRATIRMAQNLEQEAS
jgi:serine/threonine protein kinase